MKRNFGFTLAEVLITLGILGIVMEITIPTLMQNMAEKQTVGMLKKEYSVLSQAYTMAVQENGTPDNWNLGATNSPSGALNMLNILQKYLKFSQNCGNGGSGQNCFPTVTYKLLNKTNYPFDFNTTNFFANARLVDGTNLAVFTDGPNALNDNLNEYGVIVVDINGDKGPNQWGRDLFDFYLTNNGIVARGSPAETTTFGIHYSFSNDCLAGRGYGCTAWVLYNENLDYLHCSNLDWNGPTKCQ